MTTALKRDEVRPKEIPDVILDPSSGKNYLKGRFLGKVRNMSSLDFGGQPMTSVMITDHIFL